MLEELKQKVYEANMQLQNMAWLLLPGEMFLPLTREKGCLSSSLQV